MNKKLHRSMTDKKLAGVCGGIAEYLKMDATIVRLIWAFLTLISWGTGLILYIIAAFVIPEEKPEDIEAVKKNAVDAEIVKEKEEDEEETDNEKKD